MFDKNEIIQILIAIILIAWLVAFPLKTTTSFLIALGMAVMILLPHVLAHKFAAHKLNCRARFTLLDFRRFGFSEKYRLKYPIPVWLIIPVLFVFLTKGIVKIFTIEGFTLDTSESRVGRIFTELSESEIAAIAVVGPITNLIIAFFASFVDQNFAILNVWFALFSLIPLGNLDGTKIFFGGRILWAFMFILTLAMLILLHVTNPIISLITGLILAAVITIWLLKMNLS